MPAVFYYSLLLIVMLLSGCATDPSSPGVPEQYPGHKNPASIKDAVPKSEPISRYGNPPSYEVFGKRYYVLETSEQFSQQGTASWYGKPFHGRRTSSGETYDMFAMTAAHKTLPLPTYVRVNNQDNDRSVIVRINDRGPFHDGRIIDLSYAAALKLGIVANGTASVTIEAINPQHFNKLSSQAAKHSDEPVLVARNEQVSNISKHFVQLGVFTEIENAKRLQDKLLHSSLPTPEIVTDQLNSEEMYRVVIGPVQSQSQLHSVQARLDKMGIQHKNYIAP
ncbi:MAG: septal ring lytic transglycosylase RlpA family protein [Gammaproteobacteria bacterium]|nr:septal ring lytic transglycosylase RlpA family protein [Gammaproteobacteria bacterium]